MYLLAFLFFFWYNNHMENIDLTGLSPDAEAYIKTLEETIQKQQIRIDQLTEILLTMQKSMYGQSSEKSRYVLGTDGGATEQISLFNEAEALSNNKAPEPTPETIKVTSHERKPKRTKEELIKDLPVEEILCELPEEERICDKCSSNMRVLGKETVREELEIIPAQVKVLRYIRFSYVCVCCEKETGEASIKKAPTPVPVIRKSMASASTVAHVMYQKYVNAMPLARQETDWGYQGVALNRATLANWVIRAATDWLLPLWELMKVLLLTQIVILADETVIQVLKEDSKKPNSESRMWVYGSSSSGWPKITLFEYQPTRSGEHARRFLSGFKGYLQTDGYSGYEKVPDVTRCGCWSHLRRRFQEAMPKDIKAREGSAAAIGFDYCNQLFTIEQELKELDADARQKKRMELSKPVLDAYLAWLETVHALEGSKLGEAVNYSRNQQLPLSRFLEDGYIDLSTNRVEASIRPFVVGRGNWLFADTTKGAQASATIYSIVETARANNLNIYKYLLYLLSQMPTLDLKTDPTVLESLLPWSAKLPDQCRLPSSEKAREPEGEE